MTVLHFAEYCDFRAVPSSDHFRHPLFFSSPPQQTISSRTCCVNSSARQGSRSERKTTSIQTLMSETPVSFKLTGVSFKGLPDSGNGIHSDRISEIRPARSDKRRNRMAKIQQSTRGDQAQQREEGTNGERLPKCAEIASDAERVRVRRLLEGLRSQRGSEKAPQKDRDFSFQKMILLA